MHTLDTQMEIVVRGRNVTVPEHFRDRAAEKLGKLERYDGKIHRADVELTHEKNPRQNGSCQHIEITCRTRGPVVRAEACAEDFLKALDIAVEKLERRLRHAADRRRVHHGRRTPPSVAQVTAGEPDTLLPADLTTAWNGAASDPSADSSGGGSWDGPDDEHRPGRVVRRKEHLDDPMTVDQALLQMELVGHDFYLFKDVETSCASVVYRRHAYDYGLIRLAT